MTLKNFADIYHRIFPTNSKLVDDPELKVNSFSMKWKKITTQGTNKVAENTSFCTIAKVLQLKSHIDLHSQHLTNTYI